MLDFSEEYVNPRNLPRVNFINDVRAYLSELALPTEKILQKLQDEYSKFKLIERKLLQSHASFSSKVPEIEKNLEVIEFLNTAPQENSTGEAGSYIPTTFSLGDTLYVDGEIKVEKPTQSLGVWLGANVMVEYAIDEAKELLNRNLTHLKKNIANTSEDLGYIREQIIVLEVNMARVYNNDVQNRTKVSQ